MRTYNFMVTLIDAGLPYPNIESATKDADEWAAELANLHICTVYEVRVEEDIND